jgi:hypothetical protein
MRHTAYDDQGAPIMRTGTIGQLADHAPVCAKRRGKGRPSMPDPRPIVECWDCGGKYRWTWRPDICHCGAALHDGWRSLPFILWEIAARAVSRVDLRRFW